MTNKLCKNAVFVHAGRIVFLQEPKNVTVAEMVDAFFACSYRGTVKFQPGESVMMSLLPVLSPKDIHIMGLALS